jgi:hypothetical protein
MMLRESVGLASPCGPPEGIHFATADVNCDGVVNGSDALDLLRDLSGDSEIGLPSGCPQVGAPLTE